MSTLDDQNKQLTVKLGAPLEVGLLEGWLDGWEVNEGDWEGGDDGWADKLGLIEGGDDGADDKLGAMEGEDEGTLELVGCIEGPLEGCVLIDGTSDGCDRDIERVREMTALVEKTCDIWYEYFLMIKTNILPSSWELHSMLDCLRADERAHSS